MERDIKQMIRQRIKLQSEKMEIRPITFKRASDFINKNHRHHNATIGCKFAVGLYKGDRLIGCAVCGRPVSRHLDNGLTCEINRLCTDGTKKCLLYAVWCLLQDSKRNGVQKNHYLHSAKRGRGKFESK